MNAYIVWIDREHAKIFQFTSEKMERKSLSVKRNEHHTHATDGIDHMRNETRLFAEAVPHLKDAEKILILGPGVAKHHFQTFLGEHHPALARKVIACETVDHPSDGQVAAYARRHLLAEEAMPLKKEA